MKSLASMDSMRWWQLLFAVLGLIFVLSCQCVSNGVAGIYALTIVYIIVIVIGHISSRSILSSRGLLIADSVFGLLTLVVATLMVIPTQPREFWHYLLIVNGFIETALFVITIYARI